MRREPARLRSPRKLLLPALAASVAIGAGCGGGPTPVQVTAQNYRFSPATIEVTQKQTVRFVLRNPDSTEHDFQVDGLEVMVGAMPAGHVHEAGSVPGGFHVHAEAGATTTVTFVPMTKGTFQIYCTVPGHKDAGMVGTLSVR